MPYHKRTTRRKSKKRQTTKAIALSNKSKINTLIKANTTKYYPTTVNNRQIVLASVDFAGNTSGTPAVYNLTNFLRPVTTITDNTTVPPTFIDENVSRLDRFITIKHISLHCKWECPIPPLVPDALNYCNTMLILDREPITASGLQNPTVLTDILDTRVDFTIADPDHNLYFYDNNKIGKKQRYDVLHRKRIVIGPDQPRATAATPLANYPEIPVNQSGSLSRRYVKINLTKPYKISYNEDNNETNQALKLLVWTDSRVVPHPNFTFVARISFRD